MPTITINAPSHNLLKKVKSEVKAKTDAGCSLSEAILELGKRAGINMKED